MAPLWCSNRAATGGRPYIPAALAAAIAIAIFANAIPNEFVLDDFAALVDNPAAHWPLELEAIFTTNYWGDRPNYENLTIYRPLATLTFALTDALGTDIGPATHRVFNILLHAACTLLVYALAHALALLEFASPSGGGAPLPRKGAEGGSHWHAPFAASLLFALHPVHVEAVVGVVSRAELLAAFFVLLGTLVYLRGRSARPSIPLLSGIFALALLSKESGATLWGVIIGIQLVSWLGTRQRPGTQSPPHAGSNRQSKIENRKSLLVLHLSLASVLASYLLLRWGVLDAVLGGDVAYEDNPMVAGPALARVLTPFKVFFWYLRLLVAPSDLTIDYSLNHLKAVTSVFDPEAIAGLVVFGGASLAALLLTRRERAVAAATVSFFATYMVVSNLLFPSTIIMAERLVYLPSAFFIVAMVALAQRGLPALPARAIRFAGTALMSVLCLLMGAGTVMRNLEWRTPLALYSAAVETAPESAKARHLLANELRDAGRLNESLPHYSAAVSISPGNFVARTNFARTLAKLGRFDEALDQLRVALTLSPGHSSAMHLVCAIFERTGSPPGAAEVCFPSDKNSLDSTMPRR